MAKDDHLAPQGSEALPITTQVTYGVGQVAGQILRDVPSLLLLFFMTNVLGVPAAVAGTVIFVPKLFVAASADLIVGVIADRLKARIPLYWWLLSGAVLAPIAMLLLFNVPTASQGFQLGYIAVVLSLYMVVFASFSVPYLAIASALSNDPHQRTVLMAWRIAFTAIGILVAGGLAPVLVAQWGADRGAYSLLSLILAAICCVSLLIAFVGARRALSSVSGETLEAVDTAVDLRAMAKAVTLPRFAVLLGANLIQLIGSGMTYAAMIYFLSYGMGILDPLKALGIITVLLTAGIILAQPIWVKLAKRTSKKTVYITGSILHALVIGTWGLTAGTIGLQGAFVFAFLTGVANSGWAMLGFSMVADIAGEGRSGLFSSIWIAADKIGFALGGTFLIGLVLSGFGFDSAKAVAGLAQSESARLGTVFGFALIPAFLYLLGGIIMYFFWKDAPEQSIESK